MGEAAFRGVAEASRLIDLRAHQGEHPRMGAADVVPFIPIRGDGDGGLRRPGPAGGGADRAAICPSPCSFTRRRPPGPSAAIWPTCARPSSRGFGDLIGTDTARDPDFGPRAIHPSAGAVAVGARHLLVAFNVYLNTPDQDVARAIARAVRHQSGGLRFVKALGIAANEAGRVHVSMNLVNTGGTPIHRVVEMIRSEAARYGVAMAESEVVGLVSADALLDAAEHYLQLNSFSRSQLLEYRLLESAEESGPATSLVSSSVAGFAMSVASGDPVPGGGSVAALVGALAASLVAMVSRLTVGRKRFAGVEEQVRGLESRAEALRGQLLRLVDEDSAAYTAYMAASRLAKSGEEGAGERLREASLHAARVPLESATASLEAMELALEVATVGNPVARTDAQMAGLAAHAAVLGACLNVRVNLPGLAPDQRPEELEQEAAALERRAGDLLPRILAAGGS